MAAKTRWQHLGLVCMWGLETVLNRLSRIDWLVSMVDLPPETSHTNRVDGGLKNLSWEKSSWGLPHKLPPGLSPTVTRFTECWALFYADVLVLVREMSQVEMTRDKTGRCDNEHIEWQGHRSNSNYVINNIHSHAQVTHTHIDSEKKNSQGRMITVNISDYSKCF